MAMSFSMFANQVFPGFSLIKESVREVFLQSPEGQQLETDFTARSSKIFDASWLYGPQLNSEKVADYRLLLADKPSFIALRTQIVRMRLQKKYTWFADLNDDNQMEVASLRYSQDLFLSHSEEDFTQWSQSFYRDSHDDIKAIQQDILQNRADHLLHFFHFLINTEDQTAQKERLMLAYQQALAERKTNFDKVETIWVSNLLHALLTDQLQVLLQGSIAEDQLDEAAQALHQAAGGQREWSTKTWFDLYQRELLAALNQQTHFKAGHTWKGQQAANLAAIQGSLSWLFQNVSQYEPVRFLNEVGEAQLFFQYCGFTTQSGGIIADFFDFYNFARQRETINEIKSITAVLVAPHRHLINEYRHIAKYEKNVWHIFFRALMPVMVMGLFLAGVCMLLTPLALPEIFSILMMIPALYVGAAIASGYIDLRNQLATGFHVFWWGGTYNTPEFQVNARMVEAFGQPNAACVRTFYVEELDACAKIEEAFVLRSKDGLLSETDIAARNKNLIRRNTLALEWYDMHSNFKVGFDKAPMVFGQRIYQDSVVSYESHQKSSKEYVVNIIEQLSKKEAYTQSPRLERSGFFQFHDEQTNDKLKQCAESSRQLKRLGLFTSFMNQHDTKPHEPKVWNYPPLTH